MRKVAASILGFSVLTMQERIIAFEKAGIEYWHLDIMDLNFVPNLSFGLQYLDSLSFTCPLQVHLMVNQPSILCEQILHKFSNLRENLDCVFVHSLIDRSELEKTLEFDLPIALAINPEVQVEDVKDLLDKVGKVLIMGVNPGFGGQRFMSSVLEKVIKIKALKPDLELWIDGGINAETILEIPEYVNVVSGSYLNKLDNLEEGISVLSKT